MKPSVSAWQRALALSLKCVFLGPGPQPGPLLAQPLSSLSVSLGVLLWSFSCSCSDLAPAASSSLQPPNPALGAPSRSQPLHLN